MTLEFDLPVKIGTGVLIWLALLRGSMSRWIAALLVGSYLAYAVARVVWFSADRFGAA